MSSSRLTRWLDKGPGWWSGFKYWLATILLVVVLPLSIPLLVLVATAVTALSL